MTNCMQASFIFEMRANQFNCDLNTCIKYWMSCHACMLPIILTCNWFYWFTMWPCWEMMICVGLIKLLKFFIGHFSKIYSCAKWISATFAQIAIISQPEHGLACNFYHIRARQYSLWISKIIFWNFPRFWNKKFWISIPLLLNHPVYVYEDCKILWMV